MDHDPFRMPTYDITLARRYQRREGAPDAIRLCPPLCRCPTSRAAEGKVEFFDIAHPSSLLTTRDFRQIYDPAL